MNGSEKLIIECDRNFIFYTKHLESLRKNIAIQEEAKKLLIKLNPKTDFTDFIEMEHFNNYNGYLTIAILELSVNLKNVIIAQTNWEKIFFIKNSYLIIHETLNKLNPSGGKSFVQISIEKGYPSLKFEFNDLINNIDDFKKIVNYKKIENTRHYTAGHIEKSLKKYYDTILDLDGEEAAKYINDFIKILNKALSLTKNYALQANKNQQERSQRLNNELDTMLDKIQKLLKT